MLEDLRAALLAADHPTALELALAAWRETRAPGLADIVEAVAAKCPALEHPAADTTLHAWWIDRAVKPDARTITTLLATWNVRAGYLDTPRDAVRDRWARSKNPLAPYLRSSSWCNNFHERLGLVFDWRDDPRVARVLTACVTAPISAYPIGEPVDRAIVERLGKLRDIRMRQPLAICADEPRGDSQAIRDRQIELATAALAAIEAEPPPRDAGPLLAECVALAVPPPLPPPPQREDIAALWREVAANPDDVGTRAILGDALVEAGDLRGDLIVLQCNARVPNRPLRGAVRDRYDGRVKTLLRRQWQAWLGDLALVLVRRGSAFRCGMLEVARVGHHTTPPWAWAKVRGHRELCAVHTVLPGSVSAESYATFVGGLAREPRTLGIHCPEMLAALAQVRGELATRTLILQDDEVTPPTPASSGWRRAGTLHAALDQAAKLFPALAELAISSTALANELVPGCETAQRRFPQLQRIRLTAKSLVLVPQAIVNQLRANPVVEIQSS